MIEFVHLPYDVVLYILFQLSGQELLELGNTNRQIHNMCDDDRLWRQKIEQEFPLAAVALGSRQQYHDLVLARSRARVELAPHFNTVFPDPHNIRLPPRYSTYLLVDYEFPLVYWKLDTDKYYPLYSVKLTTPDNYGWTAIFNYIMSTPMTLAGSIRSGCEIHRYVIYL